MLTLEPQKAGGRALLQHDLPGYLPQYILFRGISKKEEVVEKEEKREGEPYCKKVEVPGKK